MKKIILMISTIMLLLGCEWEFISGEYEIEKISFSTKTLNGISYSPVETAAGFSINNIYFSKPETSCYILVEIIDSLTEYNTYSIYFEKNGIKSQINIFTTLKTEQIILTAYYFNKYGSYKIRDNISIILFE